MDKKIIVIGSNSFSGSDFIDLLLGEKGFQVVGISRSPEKSDIFLPFKRHKKPKYRFYQLDLNKDIKNIISLIGKFNPDYIVNFAAQSEVAPSWEHPEHWFETNVVSLARLGNFLRKTGIKKYMHISSPEVYGTCDYMVKEDAVFNPSTPYAASKAAADLFLATLVKNFKFPLITIRSTNVYGAHQQLYKIIPRSIILIKKGMKIKLHGGGRAIKSYIHIRDISEGEMLALTRGRTGEIYHLSPNKSVAVADVVKLICKKKGVDFHQVTENVTERLGQDKAYIINSTKARKTLNWQPKISLEAGIDGVIEWINSHWTEIRELPIEYIHKP